MKRSFEVVSKRFLIILAVLALAFLGIFFVSKNKDSGGQSGGSVQPSNHTVGSADNGVTLIEYGDFQCPSCGQYFPILQQVKAKYGDKILFQFRNFPLTQIHPNAMAAHRAAEAAAKQNKFWEMHDLLYERQQLWSSSSGVEQIFQDYAQELGLNIEQFKQDVASSEVSGVINADIAEAKNIGATGTPTFVLNGQKVENIAPTVDAFSALIDPILEKGSSS